MAGRQSGQSHLCSCLRWLLSGQKAVAAKEQWKELKATYQEHVEAITRALSLALPRMEEAQRKRAQLQEALEQLQAKVGPGGGRGGQARWGGPLATSPIQPEKHSSFFVPLLCRSKRPWRS